MNKYNYHGLDYLDKNFYTLSEKELEYLTTYVDSIINKKDLSSIEKKLIMRLAVREKCLYYGYPTICTEFFDFNNNDGARYEGTKNKITFNENCLSNGAFQDSEQYPFYSNQTTELERLLLIANHECEHYFQHYDLKNGILSKKSFSYLIFTIFNKVEYKKNYKYKEVENYANTKGWYDTIRFMTNHHLSKSNYSNLGYVWLQSNARQNISYQTNMKEEKSKIIEDYNIKELIDIVKEKIIQGKNPIEQYPILAHFFYSKEKGEKYGELKELNELILQYQMTEQEYGKRQNRKQVEEAKFVYRQFFYYIFGQEASKTKEGQDISTIPIKYIDVIYDLAFHDLISLQGLFDIKNKPPKAYERIFKIKIDRINKFIDRIEQTDSYSEWDKIENTIRETLKVYETSKRMYNECNNIVDDA